MSFAHLQYSQATRGWPSHRSEKRPRNPRRLSILLSTLRFGRIFQGYLYLCHINATPFLPTKCVLISDFTLFISSGIMLSVIAIFNVCLYFCGCFFGICHHSWQSFIGSYIKYDACQSQGLNYGQNLYYGHLFWCWIILPLTLAWDNAWITVTPLMPLMASSSIP